MVTIRDVAAHASVSVGTVSAVLNGRASVRPALAARVRASVTALDYQPNGLARSFKRQRTHMLGLVLSDITNPFFTTLARAVADTARQRGYTLLLGNTDEDSAQEEAYVALLRSRQLDGLLLVPGPGEHTFLPDLLARRLPFVSVDRSLVHLGVDSVLADHLDGAYQAVKHLLALGHQRVGIVTGIRGLTSTEQRLVGYRRAHDERGLPIDPALVREGDSRIAGGARCAAELLALPAPPTALFVTNNRMTVGALQAIGERRLRCPEDVALASFDDFEWASVFRPRLTAIRQPVYAIGAMATDLLIDRIEGTNTGEAREVLLPSVLVVRESCGAALRGQRPTGAPAVPAKEP